MKVCALPFFVILACITFQAEASPQKAAKLHSNAFNKDAAQFCFTTLSPEEQGRYYDRLLNIGASFTHGCSGCDKSTVLRSYNELTDDLYSFRRNYLAQFLKFAPWKNPDEFSFEAFAILENDANSRPDALIPEWQLKREGYTGVWRFDPLKDKVTLADKHELETISNLPGFLEDAKHVGGIERRFSMEPRKSLRHGVFYQTIPGRTAKSETRVATLFDLATDGARMADLFRYYGDKSLFDTVIKSGWKDPEARRLLIASTAANLKATKPHLIFAIDILFWDTAAHAFSLLRDARPKSLTMRFITALVARSSKGDTFFNEARRLAETEDFYAVLRELSLDNGEGQPVPILLGRVLDNPLAVFTRPDYEPIIGALFGQYMATNLGQNFTNEFIAWLRKISYAKGADDFVNAVEPAWFERKLKHWDNKKNLREPRSEAYVDPLTGISFSAKEIQEARNAYEAFENALLPALNRHGITESYLYEAQRRSNSFAGDPAGGGRHTGTLLPAFVLSIASTALLNAMEDLPGFIKGLDTAMNMSNLHSRAFTSRADNNVHLVNADEFYTNFGAFLKPETMHPSLYGARLMSDLVISAVCKSRGAN